MSASPTRTRRSRCAQGGMAHVKVNEVKEKILPPAGRRARQDVGQVDTWMPSRPRCARAADPARARTGAPSRSRHDALLANHPIEVPEALVPPQVPPDRAHQEAHAAQGWIREAALGYGKLLQELRPGRKSRPAALILEAIADKRASTPPKPTSRRRSRRSLSRITPAPA